MRLSEATPLPPLARYASICGRICALIPLYSANSGLSAAARLRRARLQAEQKVRKSEPVPHVLALRMSQDAQVVITAYAQHWLDRRRRVRSRSMAAARTSPA